MLSTCGLSSTSLTSSEPENLNINIIHFLFCFSLSFVTRQNRTESKVKSNILLIYSSDTLDTDRSIDMALLGHSVPSSVLVTKRLRHYDMDYREGNERCAKELSYSNANCKVFQVSLLNYNRTKTIFLSHILINTLKKVK